MDSAPVRRDVPQVSLLGPVLLIIYVNDIDAGLNNFISNFTDDTKIGKSMITERKKMNLQKDLRKISEWSERWEMPFKVNKCYALQISTTNPESQYEMNVIKLESVQCVKDLGITILSSLKFSHQCIDLTGKANRKLSFSNRNFSVKIKI